MDIQNLIRDKIVANIKIGTKGRNGLPQKLPYFNVEEDKVTNSDMVDIFKQLYPGEPTKLKIRFTSENPFNFKFKRYIKDGNNSKVVCIGNGTKAITIGKDAKGNSSQIEVECSEECEHLKSGKCKLKGNLKFVLDGIEAGGVWNLSTSGAISLSNIASEIVKYKKAKMSIVDVPFELTLTEQQSLAYGTYYSIDLQRSDIKPHLVNADTSKQLSEGNKEIQKLAEGDSKVIEKSEKKTPKKTKNDGNTNKEESKTQEIEKKEEQKEEVDLSHVCIAKSFMPTLVNGKKFDKIIFNDINGQDVEYILHPRADQKIISLGVGTVIDIKEAKMEMNKNILCKYDIKQVQNADGTMSDYVEEELKEAV